MIGFLYDYLYSYPIFLSLLLCAGHYDLLDGHKISLCICGTLSLVSVVAFYNIKSKLRYLIPGMIIAVCAGIVVVIKPGARYDFINANIWILFVFIFSILSFLIGKISSKIKWIRRFICILIIASMVFVMYRQIEISRAAVILAYFQILLYVADEIQREWKKSGCKDNRHHLVYITPFVLIICICAYFVPVKDEPYDWKIVKSSWEKVVDVAKTISTHLPGQSDESARVGFSEKAIMRGVIQQYPKELLTLKADPKAGKIVYLSGKSFDTFSGREWEAKHDLEINSKMLDTIELQCAVKSVDPDYVSDYIKRTKLGIHYELFNTRYLFVPAKAEIQADKIPKIPYVDKQNSLFANKRIAYGSEYEVYYYRLNTDNLNFNKLLEESTITEDEWENNRKRFYYNDESMCTYEDYLKYKEAMIADYSEEIVLSDELKKVLDEVYGDATSEWEKLKRLEAWLGTFTYSTTPGNIPDYVQDASSFLDYFILEKREGYCMHYATVFTLLARAEGLPARFVQGLYVNRGKLKSVMVTADNAHAWPEVYFDNVGWIPFEPTPKYHYDSSWELNSRGNKANGSNIDYAAYYKQQNIRPESALDTNNEIVKEESKKSLNRNVILAPIVLSIIFVILFLTIYSIVMRRKISKLDLSSRAKLMCANNLKILSYIGYSLKPSETLEELMLRALVECGDDSIRFIELYERLLYSDCSADDGMMTIIEQSRVSLLEILDRKKRYTKFLYRMIIVGMLDVTK